jgi:ankyrin repeat protein
MKDRVSKLVRAIETGNLVALLGLLDQGCDINAPMERDGWPPICCAVASRHPNIVAALLDRGADPDHTIQRGMAQGMVALDFCQDVPIGRMLLDAGAHTDLSDRHGRTPLDWAHIMARQDMIALLTE